MDRRKLIYGAVIGVVVLVAAYVMWQWRPANNANRPDGVFFICGKKGCHHEWNMTMREFSDHHQKNYGQPVPCPKCGDANSIKSDRCAHCGKLSPVSRAPRPCPHCKKMPAGPPA